MWLDGPQQCRSAVVDGNSTVGRCGHLLEGRALVLQVLSVSWCVHHRIALGLQDHLTDSIQQSTPVQLLPDSPEVKELLGKVDTLEGRQAVLVAAAKRHAAGQMQQLPDSVCRLALPNRLEQAGSMHKLAVIMPYRDRADHLAIVVPRLHEYLKVRSPACQADQLH